MRTVLIPGLGADAELFYPQKEALGRELVVCLPQREPLAKSFTAAAEQLAHRMKHLGLTREPYQLGGMSFGGSLAVEMTRFLDRKPQRLMLIAANRTRATLPLRFAVARSLGGFVPRSVVPAFLRGGAGLLARRERLDAEQTQRLRGMSERVNYPLLMAGARAIAGWRFNDDDIEAQGVPVRQIHGRGDGVIPPVKRHVTDWIEEGRHLINWTHAERVNAWLMSP
ncbi:alpha/beta fold hydrolase [Botrimarina hoheduenensis]|uniref:Thioesterase domain protein n=1 Tax=Botrimarina hoheduenensis TaxID=2528000 RepID=A0A5C5WCK5_9BACT|nr:alpha/beta hydrolase [Botrimarina hoheduenensis]TWT47781.1 Thioesterase domain protein [Botrimarina hoheduenensis]